VKKAKAEIYLDGRKKKNGKHSIKIKITLRGRSFYSTGVELTKIEFTDMMNQKKGRGIHQDTYNKLNKMLVKSNDAISELKYFTHKRFQEKFLEQRTNSYDLISSAYDAYKKKLEENEKISTSESYSCSFNSINRFQKNLKFVDITPKLLEEYQKWMLQNNKSVSTVGIYLRPLKRLFNYYRIPIDIYPFGKAGFKIPQSLNKKLALSKDQVKLLYNYKGDENKNKRRAVDLWVMMYLCNGINLHDILKIKWKHIESEYIRYVRQKTKDTKSVQTTITISIKPRIREIIQNWGVEGESDDFVFSFFKKNMTAKKIRAIKKNLMKEINRYMKIVAKELGIEEKLTTIIARHSFATIMYKEGNSLEEICELMGHSSIIVTRRYIDSFNDEHLASITDSLTKGF
jgi:integrase